MVPVAQNGVSVIEPWLIGSSQYLVAVPVIRNHFLAAELWLNHATMVDLTQIKSSGSQIVSQQSIN